MSYEGDEKGLDLSWTSDLKTAWAARDDESAGSASNDSSTRESSGETIGGTTEDDFGSETTSLLPQEVDATELTDTQQAILEAAIMRPTASKVDVAAAADASPQYVADICGRWLSDHPAAAAVDDDADTDMDMIQTTLSDWESRGDGHENDSTSGTIVEEMVKCGNESYKCNDGNLHGPYLYRYWSESGSIRSEYVGKPDGGGQE